MSSADYWRKREAENLKNNLKTEAEYTRTINGYYDYMMDQCQKEINGFYAKYASKEGITLAEAKKRVLKMDIEEYGRKAAKYVKNKDFSDQANEEMRLYNATMKINRLEMLKANMGLELVDGFDDLQKYFDKILTDRTLFEFERQAGILGEAIHNNSAAAKVIVNASFNNAKYSDRIWMYQGMMKAELSKLLQQGLIQGKNPRQLARHLEKLFGVRKSDAQRLMRTELSRVQAEAQKQSFERNGFKKYEFIALGSACEICRAIDGKHFDVDKMMPGENAPPLHPNCRCSVACWEDGKDYEEWLDYLDKGGTTKEWNQLKSKGETKLKDTTDKWAEDAKKELLKDEKTLSMRYKEVAVIYDKNGNFLFTKRGVEKEVSFTRKEAKRLSGNIVSHNHPSGASFSIADIKTLKKANITELRAVGKDGVYFIRPPKKWPTEIADDEKLVEELYKIKSEVRKHYQNLYENGKINKRERFILSTDEYNRVFAEKYGFKYGKDDFIE